LPRLYDDTSRVRSALVSIGSVEPTNIAVDTVPASIATCIAHPLPWSPPAPVGAVRQGWQRARAGTWGATPDVLRRPGS